MINRSIRKPSIVSPRSKLINKAILMCENERVFKTPSIIVEITKVLFFSTSAVVPAAIRPNLVPNVVITRATLLAFEDAHKRIGNYQACG